MHVCDYCEKVFTKKYNLNRHLKTATYCLENRIIIEEDTFDCEHCDKKFTRKDNLVKHERCYHNTDVSIESDSEDASVIEKLMDTLKEIQKQNSTVMKDMQQYNQDIIKKMLDMIDNKSTNSRSTLADTLLPITDDDLAAYLDNLSLEFIRRGVQGYADYAGSYPFKGKVICTDKSRNKIQYKNEDGTLTTDGRALAQRFFQAIEEKNTNIINKEYTKLQCRLQNIIDTDTVGEEDVSEILKQASFIQNMLIKIQNAAQGKDDEFVQMFLTHLSKKV